MATQTNNEIKQLKQGNSVTFKLSDGGDFASMRAIFKYGQEITLSPVHDYHDVQVGDIVYLKWRGGGYILHIVQEINGDQFLIANSLGKINGWAHGSAILAKVTRILDPETRPEVPEMLDILSAAYASLIQKCAATTEDAQRLEGILQDLRWYAERLGPQRWARLPRQNKWSFESNLWYATRNARQAAEASTPQPVATCIDQGKWIVGLAAEIMALFEAYDWEY